jgi:hypothetical protein
MSTAKGQVSEKEAVVYWVDMAGQLMMAPDTQRCAIPLTRGLVAWVSPHRYAELSQYRWCATRNGPDAPFYAVRNSPRIDGKSHMVYMARQILGLERGDPREADHVNPEETLNNTDENLRIATSADQKHNQRRRKTNTSGYKGVSFDRKKNLWRARIWINRVEKWLGYYESAERAHVAYCEAAGILYGEFARVE